MKNSAIVALGLVLVVKYLWTTLLFLYDRFAYFLTRAYGANYKIALNPVMILCYHPSCLSKNRRPLKLRHLFDIHYYLRHLKDHSDVIGNAMQLRFSAIAENHFSELDQISPSPYSLNPSVKLSRTTVINIEMYGIDRQLSVNYVFHWKDKHLLSNLI